MNGTVVGRLAPSPTGAQHLGNARTFLIAWLAARSLHGKLILRIEDIDSPRIKPWAVSQAIEDLHWLGLDWDEGPNSDDVHAPGPHAPYVQTLRLERYREGLKLLAAANQIYPCTCSRGDIEQAASAPQSMGQGEGLEGPVYPGTCAARNASDVEQLNAENYAWRFRCYRGERHWRDHFCGPQTLDVAKQLGDFVVGKKDGWPAYQLAVVMDDHDMGVTMVVRGDDLIPSTYRQQMLYEFFGWRPPQFWHVPLVVGSDGKRLAKRHGDTRLSTYRERGVSPQDIIGWLALSCGWIERFRPCSPQELLLKFCWDSIPKKKLICIRDMLDFSCDLPLF